MASCSKKVFTPYDCLLISVAYVALCRVDCLWVIGVPVAVAWWFYGRDEKRSDAAARLIGPASLRERRHCNGQIRYKVRSSESSHSHKDVGFCAQKLNCSTGSIIFLSC